MGRSPRAGGRERALTANWIQLLSPALLAVLALSARVQGQDAQPATAELTAADYQRRVEELGRYLERRPSDQTARRYQHEYETAIGQLDAAHARHVPLGAISAACRQEKAELVVFGEHHGASFDDLRALLGELARAFPDRRRVFLHEALFVEWREALGGDLSAQEMVTLAREVYEPVGKGLSEPQGETWIRYVDTMYGDYVAPVCSTARSLGYELRGAVSIATIRSETSYYRAPLRQSYRDYQRWRDDQLLEQARLATRETGAPLVVLGVGNHHALGAGRVATRWEGRRPIVVLNAYGWLGRRLDEAHPDRPRDGAWQLDSHTFCVPNEQRRGWVSRILTQPLPD